MSLRALRHHDLDWPTLLREVTEQGAAFAAHAVRRPVCEQLVDELRDGPYQPVEPVIGQVRQETESFEVAIPEPDRYPVLSSVCDELIRRVHEHGIPQWVPNEVSIQRYWSGSVGITPHRDQRRYAQLVAVITIAGSAPFTLCRNRDGDPIRTWQATEGSLVLLRGPGLADDPDGRPMHLVGGPTGTPRTSIGIRMDTAYGNGTPVSCLSDSGQLSSRCVRRDKAVASAPPGSVCLLPCCQGRSRSDVRAARFGANIAK